MPRLTLPLSGTEMERPKYMMVGEQDLLKMKETLKLHGSPGTMPGLGPGEKVLLYTSEGEAFLSELGQGEQGWVLQGHAMPYDDTQYLLVDMLAKKISPDASDVGLNLVLELPELKAKAYRSLLPAVTSRRMELAKELEAQSKPEPGFPLVTPKVGVEFEAKGLSEGVVLRQVDHEGFSYTPFGMHTPSGLTAPGEKQLGKARGRSNLIDATKPIDFRKLRKEIEGMDEVLLVGAYLETVFGPGLNREDNPLANYDEPDNRQALLDQLAAVETLVMSSREASAPSFLANTNLLEEYGVKGYPALDEAESALAELRQNKDLGEPFATLNHRDLTGEPTNTPALEVGRYGIDFYLRTTWAEKGMMRVIKEGTPEVGKYEVAQLGAVLNASVEQCISAGDATEADVAEFLGTFLAQLTPDEKVTMEAVINKQKTLENQGPSIGD